MEPNPMMQRSESGRSLDGVVAIEIPHQAGNPLARSSSVMGGIFPIRRIFNDQEVRFDAVDARELGASIHERGCRYSRTGAGGSSVGRNQWAIRGAILFVKFLKVALLVGGRFGVAERCLSIEPGGALHRCNGGIGPYSLEVRMTIGRAWHGLGFCLGCRFGGLTGRV